MVCCLLLRWRAFRVRAFAAAGSKPKASCHDMLSPAHFRQPQFHIVSPARYQTCRLDQYQRIIPLCSSQELSRHKSLLRCGLFHGLLTSRNLSACMYRADTGEPADLDLPTRYRTPIIRRKGAPFCAGTPLGARMRWPAPAPPASSEKPARCPRAPCPAGAHLPSGAHNRQYLAFFSFFKGCPYKTL